MASISGNINIQVKNNLDRQANFTLLGGTQDPTDGQANATTLYEWNVGTENFINKEAVEIFARNVNNNNLTKYTVENPDGEIPNASTVVSLLNTLQIGEFNLKDGNVIWIINDNIVYGDLTIAIQPNFQASQFVKDAYAYFDSFNLTDGGETAFATKYQGVFDYAIANVSNFVQNIQATGYGLVYPFVADRLNVRNGEDATTLQGVLISENTDLVGDYKVTNFTSAYAQRTNLDTEMVTGTRVNSANLLYFPDGLSSVYMSNVQFSKMLSTATSLDQIPIIYENLFNSIEPVTDSTSGEIGVHQVLNGSYLNLDTTFGNQGTNQGQQYYYYNREFFPKEVHANLIGTPNTLGVSVTDALALWNTQGQTSYGTDFFAYGLANQLNSSGSVRSTYGVFTSDGYVQFPTDTLSFGNLGVVSTGRNELVLNFRKLAGSTPDLDGNTLINVDWDSIKLQNGNPSKIGKFNLTGAIGMASENSASEIRFVGSQGNRFVPLSDNGQTTGNTLDDFVIGGEPYNVSDDTQCFVQLNGDITETVSTQTGSYPILKVPYDPFSVNNTFLKAVQTSNPTGLLPKLLLGRSVYKYAQDYNTTFRNNNVVWTNGSLSGEDSAISYGTRLANTFGLTLYWEQTQFYGDGFTNGVLDLRDNTGATKLTLAGQGAGLDLIANLTTDTDFLRNKDFHYGIKENNSAVEVQTTLTITSDNGNAITNALVGVYQQTDATISPTQVFPTVQSILDTIVINGLRKDVATTIGVDSDEITRVVIGSNSATGYDVFDAFIYGLDSAPSNPSTGELEINGLTIESEPISATLNGNPVQNPYGIANSPFYRDIGGAKMSLKGATNFNKITLNNFKANSSTVGYGEVGTVYQGAVMNVDNGIFGQDIPLQNRINDGYFNPDGVPQAMVRKIKDAKLGLQIADYNSFDGWLTTLFSNRAGDFNSSSISLSEVGFDWEGVEVQLNDGNSVITYLTPTRPTIGQISGQLESTNHFSGLGGEVSGINTSFKACSFTDDRWAEADPTNRSNTNNLRAWIWKTGIDNLTNFKWGKEFINCSGISAIRFEISTGYTNVNYGTGIIKVDNCTSLTQLTLQNAKATSIIIGTGMNLTLVDVQGNSLPASLPAGATDDGDGGLSELIVNVNALGTSNGTLNYSNQTTSQVPIGSICQTAYNNLIARGWTITGSAPSSPPASSFNNTLDFSSSSVPVYDGTSGFSNYNPSSPTPSKTVNIPAGSTTTRTLYFYPSARNKYTSDSDITLTLPSWATESSRSLVSIATQPINSSSSQFYTYIMINVDITGNSSNTTSSVTISQTETPITFTINLTRALIGHSNFAGSFVPLSFGFNNEAFTGGTANVIDVTTLTVTGTAGDTVGTITNSSASGNSSTGADVLSVESVTGLPATVGDTIEIRLRLTIPEQRNDRTITTTAKAITFQAFDQ